MIMISRVLKKGAACVMTMMIIISNDSDNDNDITGKVKRLVCTGEASGRSPSQYVDVICLEFLPGRT